MHYVRGRLTGDIMLNRMAGPTGLTVRSEKEEKNAWWPFTVRIVGREFSSLCDVRMRVSLFIFFVRKLKRTFIWRYC